MENILKSDLDIEKKVNILKQQLREIINTHSYEIYTLLRKILKLRQSQIEGYDNKDLHKEKGLDLTREQVRYYMAFDHVSPRTKKLIAQGKLKSSTFLFIMRKSTSFFDHDVQDDVIGRYISGEINSSMINYGDTSSILSKDCSRNTEDRGYRIYYKLKSVRKMFEMNKDILENDRAMSLIRNELKKINIITENKKKGIFAKMFALQKYGE